MADTSQISFYKSPNTLKIKTLKNPSKTCHKLLTKTFLFLTNNLSSRQIFDELNLTTELMLTIPTLGYALKMLTELMASFLEQESIKQLYKGRLVGAVLTGYLSLRRLVVQRTRLIDETQEKLLELLEEMTTGDVSP